MAASDRSIRRAERRIALAARSSASSCPLTAQPQPLLILMIFLTSPSSTWKPNAVHSRRCGPTVFLVASSFNIRCPGLAVRSSQCFIQFLFRVANQRIADLAPRVPISFASSGFFFAFELLEFFFQRRAFAMTSFSCFHLASRHLIVHEFRPVLFNMGEALFGIRVVFLLQRLPFDSSCVALRSS